MQNTPELSNPPRRFYPLKEVKARLDRVLETSPADETELVWFERKRGWAETWAPEKAAVEAPILTVLIRVVEGGRMGWHRTEAAEPRELENAVREALSLAKVQAPVKKRPVLPEEAKDDQSRSSIMDRDITSLEAEDALRLLRSRVKKGERARLSWSDCRLAVHNSHGLRRAAAATEISFQIATGKGPGIGHAAASARSMDRLDLEQVAARARALASADTSAAPPPEGPVPILFSPEATVELLNTLNMFAFSARSYLDGTSFLSRHRGVQVFDRGLHLRDDGCQESGLPFPFDLEGSPKTPLDLIVAGKPSTPALNRAQGARAGLKPTAQAIGGSDSLCGNLFLEGGDRDDGELLEAAEGGIYIGHLEPPECFEPSQLRLRTRARGLRRIRNGSLAEPVEDCIWEDSLLRSLAMLRAIGRNLVTLHTRSTPLGGITAPAVVVGESAGLTPLSG